MGLFKQPNIKSEKRRNVMSLPSYMKKLKLVEFGPQKKVVLVITQNGVPVIWGKKIMEMIPYIPHTQTSGHGHASSVSFFLQFPFLFLINRDH